MKRKERAKDVISKAIDVLLDSGVDLSTLFDQGSLLKQLSKRLVEKALESEMDSHLGYNKYARSDSENARNGLSTKEVITDNGVISVEVPRDIEHPLLNLFYCPSAKQEFLV
ncbi:MAG: transposase [Candidatus Cardinium sp.]|uniref:transposase n=1 Tax=Cardinium endosymbiont of Dermatophagoides farinae TaxID=2597823 RepID=UPI0021033907|nr:transposase [Cardinium endosymbiont of Dermatophagoides farinae]UWW96525.1 MAG: transposase [Candidatus Cardinium sp.]